jgi:chromatin structure-remodeling complex subunit SFH1
MAAIPTNRQHHPQGFVSSYAPRLRAYRNSLLAPVFPQANTVLPTRTTKRGTTAINYAEDGFDDDDFDDSEGPRRPTGLRSLRRDDSGSIQTVQQEKVGKDVNAPVDVQGIWREWMGKPKRVLYVLILVVFWAK